MDRRPEEDRQMYGASESRHVSDAGGLTQFVARVETLQPGSRSSDRHWHEEEDEFLYMHSGEATVIEEDGAHPLGPGDMACWPAGVANAHQVVNRSDAPCSYLIFGSGVVPDVVHYPDRGEILYDFDDGSWRLQRTDGTLIKSYHMGPGGRHTDEDVDYAQSPPVGGKHDFVWQNCGFYDEPIRDENAVHSMKHGAVWIAYSPDLPQDQVGELRDLAHSHASLLVSPYPDLDSPIVATAWGKQLRLQSASDADLEWFIRAYSKSAQAPEPGANCYCGIDPPE